MNLVRITSLVFVVAVALVAASCADDADPAADGDADEPTDTDEVTTSTTSATSTTTTTEAPAPVVPEVVGPVTEGNGPVIPQPAVPVAEGWTVEEFFVGGEAERYELIGEAGDDGMWTAEPAGSADYRTRILVRRPPAAIFSGTVIAEWLNVSAVESSPDWAYLSEEITREGHAYVAVSAQSLGVIGGEAVLSVEIDDEAAEELGGEADDVNTGGLVNADPARYGSLAHPGDAFAFDIYTQVGTAIVDEAASVLGGLEPTTLIALGESQSAGFLTTYANAVHLRKGVYDGFLIHSRLGGGAPVDGGFGGADDGASFVSSGHRIRTDLDDPVFIFQAETDLTLLGYARARQDDTDRIRTWEVAGTAHADAHVISALLGGARDPGVGSLLGCSDPINAGPHHESIQAALHHLVEWVDGGDAPPTAPRLETEEVDDTVAIVRDELGRAIGGVRNPLVDVPVAIYSGDPPGGGGLDDPEGFGVCALFGQTFPLDQATLLDLHGSADAYVAAFEEAAAQAVADGFLLQPDADALLAEAEANRALFG